jgi:hypothetical protein
VRTPRTIIETDSSQNTSTGFDMNQPSFAHHGEMKSRRSIISRATSA